jgi:hypothetical protein
VTGRESDQGRLENVRCGFGELHIVRSGLHFYQVGDVRNSLVFVYLVFLSGRGQSNTLIISLIFRNNSLTFGNGLTCGEYFRLRSSLRYCSNSGPIFFKTSPGTNAGIIWSPPFPIRGRTFSKDTSAWRSTESSNVPSISKMTAFCSVSYPRSSSRPTVQNDEGLCRTGNRRGSHRSIVGDSVHIPK